MKSWFKKLQAFVFGLGMALLLAEVMIRIANPSIVHQDIKQLESKFYGEKNKLTISNLKGTGLANSKLDTFIYSTTNNIGFRGPDLPEHDSALYKIFAVGGSTTICSQVSDSQDWPNIVGTALHQKDNGIWMNNAGINGHSTFGHLQTLPQIILPYHPQMILFLVGCNDVKRDSFSRFDEARVEVIRQKITYLQLLYAHWKLYRLCANLYYCHITKNYLQGFNVQGPCIDLPTAGVDTTGAKLMVDTLQSVQRFIPGYKSRLKKLIVLCRNNNTLPVFVTQPTLLGDVTDSTTGVALGKISAGGCNGTTYWAIMQAYNSALIETCKEMNCPCIDLADSMPKNSLYFYDFVHFTKQGSNKVASIILGQLPGIIAANRK